MMNRCICRDLWDGLSRRSRDAVETPCHIIVRRIVPRLARALTLVVFSLVMTGGLAAGCRTTGDPLTESLAAHPGVTTPSVEAVRAATVEPSVSHRDHKPTEIHAKDGTVTHGPLYFEGPFEETGGEEGTFAQSGVDYGSWFYGLGRFGVNTVMFPISAAMTPPWHVMASDGQPSRRAWGEDYDAER